MKILRGNPTEAEIAAVVVALATRAAAPPPPPPLKLDAWRLSVRTPGVRTRADW